MLRFPLGTITNTLGTFIGVIRLGYLYYLCICVSSYKVYQ
nr:MAG TPA: hypothetical protein [Caudoviricetes sp.]